MLTWHKLESSGRGSLHWENSLPDRTMLTSHFFPEWIQHQLFSQGSSASDDMESSLVPDAVTLWPTILVTATQWGKEWVLPRVPFSMCHSVGNQCPWTAGQITACSGSILGEKFWHPWYRLRQTTAAGDRCPFLTGKNLQNGSRSSSVWWCPGATCTSSKDLSIRFPRILNPGHQT